MSFGKTNYRVGGTRGGADQFKWDDVKNDKYRENYLGHSVHAPVGRWQKGKDLAWYAKTSKEQRALELRQELLLAKQRDEDLMNQALGLAPRRREEPTGDLEANELKELLRRGDADRDGLVGERIEGIGAAPVGSSSLLDTDAAPKKTKTLAERYKDMLASGLPDTTHALPGTIDASDDNVNNAVAAGATDSRLRDRETKDERRARKAENKVRKKEKKHAKKAAKRATKQHRTDDDSDDDDDDWEAKRGRSQSPRTRYTDQKRSRSDSLRSRGRYERRPANDDDKYDERQRSRHRSRSQSLDRRSSRYSRRPSHSRSRSPRGRSDRSRHSSRHYEHRRTDDYAPRRR